MDCRERYENVESFKPVFEDRVKYFYACYRLVGATKNDSITYILHNLKSQYCGSAMRDLASREYVAQVLDQQKRIRGPPGLIDFTTELNRVPAKGWSRIAVLTDHLHDMFFPSYYSLPLLIESDYGTIEKRAGLGPQNG